MKFNRVIVRKVYFPRYKFTEKEKHAGFIPRVVSASTTECPDFPLAA